MAMADFPYKRALVTGGAGFIGSHLAEGLLDRGLEVVSLDDYSAGKRENHAHLDGRPGFTAVACDITDQQRLPAAFAGVDIVFHNAASKKTVCLKDPRRDLQVNAAGTFNLLELAVKHGVKKFVHASTGSVYGEPLYTPQDESHPLSPVSYYGVSKLAGERYVHLFHKIHGLDTTILRYFHVYGPRQESNEFGGVVAIFIRNMIRGERPVIYGDGTQQRSFTYVGDVVRANLLTAADPRARGEVYNCASGLKVTVRELCEKTIEYFGLAGRVTPRYEDWVVGDIRTFDIDNAKIRSLGMTFATDFWGKLRETIDSFKRSLA